MRRKLLVTQKSKAGSVAFLQKKKNMAWIVDLGLAYRQPSQLEVATLNCLPDALVISGVLFKNRHFSPIASVLLCGVFVLYCISLKLSESTVINHVFLILFESKGRR